MTGNPTAPLKTLGLLLAFAVGLTGCSGLFGSSGTSGILDRPSDPLQYCDGFLQASDADREIYLEGETSVFAEGLVFDADGAEYADLIPDLLAACDADRSQFVWQAFGDLDPRLHPSCADFAALRPEVAREWASVLYEYAGGDPGLGPEGNAGALTLACDVQATVDPDPSFDDAFHWLGRLMREDPWDFEELFGSPSPSSPDDYLLKWETTSELGYNFDNRLTRGGLDQAELVDFPPGSACEFDPANDAFIDLRLETFNESDRPVMVQKNLVVSVPGALSGRVMIETNLSSGDSCRAVEPTTSLNLDSVDAIAPQQSSSTSLRIIISDYRSPSFPDGDASLLSSIALQGAAYLTDSDPVVSIRYDTSESVALG